MPAKSQAQRAYLNAKFGHAWVKRHHFDNTGTLPEHVQKMEKGGVLMKHTGKTIHEAKKHTGKIIHEDMVAFHGSRGHGKKDPHEHAEHTAMNKKHGMSAGLSPANEHGRSLGGHTHGGAPSESENCEYC